MTERALATLKGADVVAAEDTRVTRGLLTHFGIGAKKLVSVRAHNERGEFTCVARVSDDTTPGVVVAPMGWWGSDWEGGRAAQATTSQRLTKLGSAPTFNDNRVELEAVTS